jgi:hypothetical protein
MIRYNKSVIDWFLEQQLLSLDPVNNCILFHDIVRRLLLFNANSAIFQLYQDENKLILNEIMMRSTLYYTNTLSCIFTVLAHWNNSQWIDMSFQASQCLFFLLKAVCLAVMQHIPISLSLVWPTPITLELSMLTITPSMCLFHDIIFIHDYICWSHEFVMNPGSQRKQILTCRFLWDIQKGASE